MNFHAFAQTRLHTCVSACRDHVSVVGRVGSWVRTVSLHVSRQRPLGSAHRDAHVRVSRCSAPPVPWARTEGPSRSVDTRFFFLFPSFCTNALMGILENIALKNGARISAWSPLWTALTGGRGALGLLGPHAAPHPQRMASLCPLQGATGPSLCPQSQCDGDSALWWRLQRMCPVGEAGPSGHVLTQSPSLAGGLGVRSLSSLLSVSASRGVAPPPGLGADLPASCIFLRGGVLQWP